jgi:hypothetical protein
MHPSPNLPHSLLTRWHSTLDSRRALDDRGLITAETVRRAHGLPASRRGLSELTYRLGLACGVAERNKNNNPLVGVLAAELAALRHDEPDKSVPLELSYARRLAILKKIDQIVAGP